MNKTERSKPARWSLKPLGAVARIVSGATPRTDVAAYWDGDIRWATPKDLSRLDDSYLLEPARRITQDGLASCSAEILPAGSVLFSSRAPIGLTAINRFPIATNQGFKSFVPNRGELDAGYLYHWLRANRDHLESLGNGATFKEVSKAVVARVEIPLPPLVEQQHIAAILDRAGGIHRKRQQALRLADDFLRSVFLDLFGDPAANPKGWPTGTVRDLMASVNYGTSQKAHSERRGVPVLRMNNITYEGGWSLGELKYVEFPEHELGKYLVHRGEMLFNRTNSRELVGKTAVFREEQPMAFAGYLVRAVAKPDTDAEYVSAYLNSAHGKTVLMAMCKSIVGMANINAQEMLSIPILVPPSQIQKRFGDTVRTIVARRKELVLADQEAETLFASLQQRAFRGEL